jgi:hypothetical protein
MPIVGPPIISSRGKEFWESLDPHNMTQVLTAVKEAYDRPEPAYMLPYWSSPGGGTSYFSQPCFRDCQVFLLHGTFFIEGQGYVTEAGCSYYVKDEVRIGVYGNTTLVIMEEGDQRGACLKHTQELQERILAEMQSPKKLKKWKRTVSRTSQQCVTS